MGAKLHGSGGLGGLDAKTLQLLLCKYGKASERLRIEVAKLANLLANTDADWAQYRALMAGRLFALYKMPGTRPIAIGEIWRRLIANLIINATKHEVLQGCGADQLSGGYSFGIEGAILAINHLYNKRIRERR